MEVSQRAEELIKQYHTWKKPKMDWNPCKMDWTQSNMNKEFIADSKTGKKKGISIAACLIIAIIIVYLDDNVEAFDDIKNVIQSSFGNLIIVLVLILIAGRLHLVIHELGHVFFGLLTGCRFVLLRLSKIVFLRVNGKTQIKRDASFSNNGECIMILPKQRNLDSAYLLLSLGGGLANLIAAAIAGIGMIFCKSTWSYVVLIVFIGRGLITAGINLIPSKRLRNDGTLIQILRKDSAARLEFSRNLELSGGLCQGKKFNDFPIEYYEGHTLDYFNYGFSQNRYYHCLAEGDYEGALKLLVNMDDTYKDMPIYLKNFIYEERLFMMILTDADKNTIIDYYHMNQKIFGAPTNDLQPLRVLYAYQRLVSHNNEKAALTKKFTYNRYKNNIWPDKAQLNIDLMSLVDDKAMRNDSEIGA